MLDVAPIRIGAACQLATRVQLLTATHPIDPEPRRVGWESAEPITIGDNVWLGGGAIVCPGVTIGENTVVGAGAVVTRDLPAGVVAAGVPARVLREIGPEDAVGGSPLAALLDLLAQPVDLLPLPLHLLRAVEELGDAVAVAEREAREGEVVRGVRLGERRGALQPGHGGLEQRQRAVHVSLLEEPEALVVERGAALIRRGRPGALLAPGPRPRPRSRAARR